jgi:hypothetical protein
VQPNRMRVPITWSKDTHEQDTRTSEPRITQPFEANHYNHSKSTTEHNTTSSESNATAEKNHASYSKKNQAKNS